MKTIIYALLFYSTLILFACHSSKDEPKADITSPMDEQEAPRTAQPPQVHGALERITDKQTKLIKTGSINFEVEDVLRAKSQIDSIVKGAGVYLAREILSNTSHKKTYDLTLHIPSHLFDAVLVEIENLSLKCTVKNIYTIDRTEEYQDLQLRKESSLAILAQYYSLLSRAADMEDILKIQNQIRHIEEEIEVKARKMLSIDRRAVTSVLKIHLLQYIEHEIAEAPTYFSDARQAATRGWIGVRLISIFAIGFWPLWVIVIGIWFVRKGSLRWWR